MLRIGKKTKRLAIDYCALPLAIEVFEEIKAKRENFLKSLRRRLATIPDITQRVNCDVHYRDLYLLARSLQHWADSLTEDSKMKWAIQVQAENAMEMFEERLKWYERRSQL